LDLRLNDIVFAFYFGALVSPGLVIAIHMLRRGVISGSINTLLFGYVLGYATAILTQTMMLHLHLSPWIAPALFPLSWLTLLIKPTMYSRSLDARAVWAENRFAWLCGLAAVTITILVLSRVGRLDGTDHVFTTLYVNDYFNHLAVSAELAKNVPPTNIYYQGGAAHYYWFFHVIPGSFHHLTGLNDNLGNSLGWLVCFNILAVFGLLWRLLLATGVSRTAAKAGLIMILLAYSYIDLFIIGRALGNAIGIVNLVPQLESIWPRIEQFSGLSHSYMRDFFVEPHAVSSMVFAIMAILIQTEAIGKFSPFWKGVFLGILVLCSFGCESFMGTILALWITVDTTLSLLRSQDKRSYLALIGGVVIVACVGTLYVFGMDMIGNQGGMLSFHPMKGVIATLPFYLTLDYGPLFLLGVAGWWLIWRKKINFPAKRIWLMAVIALGFGLFIQHAVERDILLRKSGKPLQLALLIGAVVLLDHALNKRGWAKKVAIMLMILAMPTVVFDIQAFGGFFGSRGLENRIDRTEIRALRWIHKHTDMNAVVQGAPGYHGDYKYDINPIPALAERPVAVGTDMLAALWGGGEGPAMERIREVEGMFDADSVQQVKSVMNKLNIDYLYLGPHEKKGFDLKPELFVDNDSLFEVVYDEGPVTILRYKPRNEVPAGTK
jgi:hypothetical protein